MNFRSGFIKYILVIVAILVVVFLGQQAFFRGVGKSVISFADGQVRVFMARGSNWATSAILPSISGGVGGGKEAITDAVKQQKEKISENIGEKIKNYFSNVANSIMGKNNSADCQTQTNP